MQEKYGWIAQPLHHQILCRLGQKIQAQNCRFGALGPGRIDPKTLQKSTLLQRGCEARCSREELNATKVLHSEVTLRSDESLLVFGQWVRLSTGFLAANMQALVASLACFSTITSMRQVEVKTNGLPCLADMCMPKQLFGHWRGT